jgi:hypothetical protein
VHLVDNLVLSVSQALHVVVVISPGPSTGPGIALNENVLGRGTGSTNTVDGSLVQVENQSLVHIVVLVV